jgi:hypothetical protein
VAALQLFILTVTVFRDQGKPGGAQRHECRPDRTDYRAGSYDRKLPTKAGG